MSSTNGDRKVDALDIIIKWVLPLGLTMAVSLGGSRELALRESASLRQDHAVLAEKVKRLERDAEKREGDTFNLRNLSASVDQMGVKVANLDVQMAATNAKLTSIDQNIGAMKNMMTSLERQ